MVSHYPHDLCGIGVCDGLFGHAQYQSKVEFVIDFLRPLRNPLLVKFQLNMPEDCIPPPPEKPSANECCGGGCVPCIYDYFYEAMEKWQAQYGDAYQKSNDSTEGPLRLNSD